MAMAQISLIGIVERVSTISYAVESKAKDVVPHESWARITFSVAVPQRGNKQRFHCVAWGWVAEKVSKYLKENHKVYVQGELLLHESLEQNRQIYTRMDVRVERFERLDQWYQHPSPSDLSYETNDDEEIEALILTPVKATQPINWNTVLTERCFWSDYYDYLWG